MTDSTTTLNTTSVDIVYHFKAFAPKTAGYDRLAELMEAGKLSADEDIEQKVDGDVTKLKRKSVTVKATIPVVELEGFTAEQNAHVQYLITKQLEAKNKEHIDNCSGEWVSWETVLQLPPISKSAGAVKVDAEMLAAVTEALCEHMRECGYNDGAIQFVSTAGGKKFSATVCRNVKLPVLEKVRTIVTDWMETLDEETASAVAPVTSLWLRNIDVVLNPQTDVTEDMFEL